MADEFWSYVGDKSNQRWTWYTLKRTSGTILAHHNGKRTDAACQKLIDKLAVFPIRNYYTDNWASDTQSIPVAQHMHVNSLPLHIVRCQVFYNMLL
jgi:insertion element IS1 protein InsB